MKPKKFIFSKALIIFLSLTVILSGLGLFVAGVRVKKKSWIVFGVVYTLLMWILPFTAIGAIFTVFIYIGCIIHTAMICPKYGELLNARANIENHINEQKRMQVSTNQAKSVDMSVQTGHSMIHIVDLPIEIGTATVCGDSKEQLSIKIENESGKIYEFKTHGNSIEQLAVKGKRYNYGG